MDGFGHGFRAGASFLFSVYRSAQVRSQLTRRVTENARRAGRTAWANWSKSGCRRLVELRSLLHTRGNPLVCAARAMYVIPDMDRYVY